MPIDVQLQSSAELFLEAYDEQVALVDQRARNSEAAAASAKSQAMRLVNNTYYGGRASLSSPLLGQIHRSSYEMEVEAIDRTYQTASQTAAQIGSDARRRMLAVRKAFLEDAQTDIALPGALDQLKIIYATPLPARSIQVVLVKYDANAIPPTPRYPYGR
jgi:hypothetical protein